MASPKMCHTPTQVAPKTCIVDPILGELTRDRLTRNVWVYQRKKGHRFSSDDVVTAFIAASTAPDASRVLDLGCGLGSVLLHLAWSLPEARLVGIEAQAISFALLERNVRESTFADRIEILHGDLREPEAIARLGSGFPLITGTPPYFPPESALDAEDEQRAYARVEYRGGVEAYVQTAASLLAPNGWLVLCGDSRAQSRVAAIASTCTLAIHRRCDVTPREGRATLFSVWTLARTPCGEVKQTELCLRDSAGRPTTDALRLREFSGF
ncbi:MAG: methyltransferase [Polyangiaceae bacterium]